MGSNSAEMCRCFVEKRKKKAFFKGEKLVEKETEAILPPFISSTSLQIAENPL